MVIAELAAIIGTAAAVVQLVKMVVDAAETAYKAGKLANEIVGDISGDIVDKSEKVEMAKENDPSEKINASLDNEKSAVNKLLKEGANKADNAPNQASPAA